MTDQYAVIGNPIGHTTSPLIRSTFARQTWQDINYIAIEGVFGSFREAAEACAWWHGVCPETAALISRLTVPLA